MIETLAAINAPHFFAGIVLWDDRVVEAANIVRYMRDQKWTRARVRDTMLTVKWFDDHREPKSPPDPRYPNGIDLDISRGAKSCSTALPYPAKRCGLYVITCDICGQRTIVTTAGRRDDPKSIKVACLAHAKNNQH